MFLPDLIVLSLASQIVESPTARGFLRATDGASLVEVTLEEGRISVMTIEGPEKGHPPRLISVMSLSTPQVYLLGKAYRAWLEAQADAYGLQEPVWE